MVTQRVCALLAAMLLFPLHAHAATATLAWTANTDNATGYTVYRSLSACTPTSTATMTAIATVPLKATTAFIDTTLPAGAYSVCYALKAFNSSKVESLNFSNTAGAPIDTVSPGSVTGVTVTIK